MMAERGREPAHTTIMCWVQRYVPEFEKKLGSLCTQGWRFLARRRDVPEGARPKGLSLPCRRQGGQYSRLSAESKERRFGVQGILPQGAPHLRTCSHPHLRQGFVMDCRTATWAVRLFIHCEVTF